MPIIHQKVPPDSIVYRYSWRAYNALDAISFEHYYIDHNKSFVEKKNHINGLKTFWSQAKRQLRKLSGVPREHFGLFLKEFE